LKILYFKLYCIIANKNNTRYTLLHTSVHSTGLCN